MHYHATQYYTVNVLVVPWKQPGKVWNLATLPCQLSSFLPEFSLSHSQRLWLPKSYDYVKIPAFN